MTYLPAHSEAVEDGALRGSPLAVYDWLIYRLEPHQYRPVKVLGVAIALRMKRGTVRQSLKILVSRGYLEMAPSATRAHAYRLCLTRKRAIGPLGDHTQPAA